MKGATFWIVTMLIFGVTNGMISRKEVAIRNGVTMYLTLAPRDPRSLMQGDYMALDYELVRSEVPQHVLAKARRRGKLVVRLDENKLAHFVRLHEGEPLTEGEHLLCYRHGRRQLHIGTDAFFFQEGHGQHYSSAKHGELKVAATGESVLVGLREADFSESGPPSEQ